jgi:hypothetical protein
LRSYLIKKSSGSCLENREYGRRDPSRYHVASSIRKSWQYAHVLGLAHAKLCVAVAYGLQLTQNTGRRRIWRILTMACNTQNYWISGLAHRHEFWILENTFRKLHPFPKPCVF